MQADSFEELLDILQPSDSPLDAPCGRLMKAMAQHVVSPDTLQKIHAEVQAEFGGAVAP